jgi:endogenous inhibitor of DNA gyrase (YacG/DUF329 family)/G:T-mismatch repair DNA endonuclease (very short patch repair protein)
MKHYVDKNCPQCGHDFRVEFSARAHIFCSVDCYNKSRKQEFIERSCKNCGKHFLTKKLERRPGRGTYCSRDCSNQAHSKRGRVVVRCSVCAKEFSAKTSADRRYCSLKCAKESPEWRAKQSQAKKENPTTYWAGREKSPELRAKISQSLMGNKPWNTGKKIGSHSPEHRAKLIPVLLAARMKAREVKPTGPERKIIDMMPGNIRYTGNRSWWRTLPSGKSKNPDFKVTGENKVIEVYGNYWHKGEDPADIIGQYRAIGIDCLVLWESEINKQPDMVREKIHSFVGATP